MGSIYSKKCLDGQQINYRLENIEMSRISYSTPVMINLVLGHIFEMVVNSMSVQSFLRVNRPHRVRKNALHFHLGHPEVPVIVPDHTLI